MNRIVIFSCLLASLLIGVVKADANADYKAVENKYWEWRLKENPSFALNAGHLEYADKNPQVGAEFEPGRYNKAKNLLKDLNKIDIEDLDKPTGLSYRVLKKALEVYIEGYKFREFTLNGISFMEGPQIGFSNKLKNLPFKTEKDYENYLKKLTGFAKMVDQIRDMLKEAVKVKKTMNEVSVSRVPAQIKSILDKTYDKTDYYIPFKDTLDKITDISASAKTNLRNRAKSIIENKIKKSFTDLRNYLMNDYKARPGLGVSTLATSEAVTGSAYYAAALKWHLSVEMSPEQVHQMGLDEVERIKGNMNKVKDSVGFKGSLKEFMASVKKDSSFIVGTEMEILVRAKYIINKRINPALPKIFSGLPKLNLVVKPNPLGGPMAYYMHITLPNGTKEGLLVINVKNPKTKSMFDLLAACLHEANPGHHMQTSYMLTDKSIPDFRKYTDYTGYYKVPFHFPFYTAYAEGWGLYAEYLGNELGLYSNKYELFGRYVLEIFRACRLVVDTGIHAMGWSRQKAIDYMAEHLTYSIPQIEGEVDRYVTLPGQACAYKVGEKTILGLRKKAETILGDKFNVKDFHQKILDAAALPLDLLSEIIDEYIEDTIVHHISSAA